MEFSVVPEVRSIVSCYGLCIQSFDRLCATLLSGDQELLDQRAALRDELGRFKVWAGNSGAHRIGRVSLDHRLREALHVHEKVTELLCDLNRALERAIMIISQGEGTWDTSSTDSSSDSSHSTNTPEVDEELPSTTELEYAFLDLSHVITCLYRFSVTLRQPVPRDRLQKYAAIDVSHYEFHDIQHASSKFPQAPKFLLERMGKANTRRRQLLRYHKNHHDKIARYIDIPLHSADREGSPTHSERQPKLRNTQHQSIGQGLGSVATKSSQNPGSQMNSQTTVDTFKIKSDSMDCVDAESDAGQSQTSYTTSASGRNERRLQVPPPPNGVTLDRSTPFQCPYCYDVITMMNTHHWTKHVFQDLRPYICTFEVCPKPGQMFEHRRDWYEHEMQVHRREWFCDACTQKFAVKDELVDHLRTSHQGETQESELLDVVDRCERAIVGEQACPICSEELPSKWLRGHLARHMQQLALFALPRSGEKDDDSEPPTASGSGATGDGNTTATHWSSADGSHLSFDSNPQGRTEEDFDQNTKDFDLLAPMSSITESVEYSVSPLVPTTEDDVLLERYRRVPNSKRVFSWILKARQPLTIEQLRIAVAINPYQYLLTEKDIPADNTSFLASCDRLLVINANGHVKLADRAMKESLLRSDLMAEADINIALACLTYLSFDIFKKQLKNEVEVEERETSFPFLRYAILHLSFHLKACNESHTAKAMKIFLGDPDRINSYNQLARRYGSSLMTDNAGAIHIAVLLGHMAMTLDLLAQGVALDTGDGHGRTPLHLATINGCDAVMRLLLEKGANIEAVDNDGRTSLHLAIRGGLPAVALLLIEKGANTEAVDNGGRTPLHLAIRGGLQAMSLLLIGKGANIEAFDNGLTPLHLAILVKAETMARLLIEKGADIEAAYYGGLTPLHQAIRNGLQAVALFLIEKGANIEAVDSDDNAPLHLAILANAESVSRLLIEKGTDIEAVDNDGRTPLHLAIRGGLQAVALLLIEKGANTEAVDNGGRTPLHLAIMGGLPAVALLIEKGANIEAVDNDDNTPLHLATERGLQAIALLLIEKGANTEAADSSGLLPLHLAVRGSLQGVARLLIEKGANIEAVDDGPTSLHLAILAYAETLAQLLIEKGANIEAVDNGGRTPLHLAAERGLQAVALLLIEKGANIEAVDNDGLTPLLLAAERGSEAMALLLTEKGANIEVADSRGCTPLRLAAVRDNEAIVRLLSNTSSQ